MAKKLSKCDLYAHMWRPTCPTRTYIAPTRARFVGSKRTLDFFVRFRWRRSCGEIASDREPAETSVRKCQSILARGCEGASSTLRLVLRVVEFELRDKSPTPPREHPLPVWRALSRKPASRRRS